MDDPQPVYEVDDVEVHNRATTFFRCILVIPHIVVLVLWGTVASIATLFAWFAILFTGRFPQGLYDFVGNFHRYAAAVGGYATLLTDVYPRFGVPPADAPVRVLLPERKASYNRWRVLFRIIVGIPVLLIGGYALAGVTPVGAFMNWFSIVFTGKRSRDAQALTVFGNSYQARSNVYWSLMTEQSPPVHGLGRDGLTGGVTRRAI